MMKVLHHYHVYDNPPSGGVENHINSLCMNLSRKVKFVILSDLTEKSKEKETINGIDVIRVPPVKKLTNGRIKDILINTFSREKNKRNIIENVNPDIIHLHGPTIFSNLSLIGFVFYPLYRMQGWTKIDKPKVFTFHGLPEYVMQTKYKNKLLFLFGKYFWKLIENKNLKDSEYLICVDKYVYNDMMKRNVEKGKVLYIPNGIDMNRFKPMEKSQSINKIKKEFDLDLSKSDKIFSYVARLSKEKGIEYILKMKSIPGDYKVLICGDGPYKSQVQNLCKLDKRFLYIGNVSEDMLPYVYTSSDYVLNPALHPASTRTTIEAVSCNVPTIMIEMGDRYPLINNVNGFVCKENSFLDIVKSLVSGEIRLSEDKKQLNKIRDEFDIKNIGDKIFSLYKMCKI